MASIYTFRTLRAATRREITDEINKQLGVADTVGGLDAPNYYARAQFLMQELLRRDQNRQSWIMIGCTIVIAALTAFIAYLTWRN